MIWPYIVIGIVILSLIIVFTLVLVKNKSADGSPPDPTKPPVDPTEPPVDPVKPPPLAKTNIICTTTYPQDRFTTNVLSLSFIKNLKKGDIMMLSGVYIDLDTASPFGSFLDEITSALNRGAEVFIFTDPALDKQNTYDNSTLITPLIRSGAYWFAMGNGKYLQSHIKLCDFLYLSDKKNPRGIFYYGSYNPFYPVTAEAGIFADGPVTESLISQSIFRNVAFFKTFVKISQPHSNIKELNSLIATLKTYASPLVDKDVLSSANIIYPKNSIGQCVGGSGLSIPDINYSSSLDEVYPGVPSIRYKIGLMPSAQLANYGVGPEFSARTVLFDMLGRAEKYIKIGLLFDYFSDEKLGSPPDDFQVKFMDIISAAIFKGVFVTMYVGTYNDKVNFLDKPHYSKFIAYVTRGKSFDTFKFFVYPSYSLHFKFYVTERDVLISNNMPTSSMYDSVIQGCDICFYDCSEINAFFDNTYNAFVSKFTDNVNELYMQDDAVYSIPVGKIATRTNLISCGNGQTVSDFGCCLPAKRYPQQGNTDICKTSFVPSYADDPLNPINFFQVMLFVINTAKKFIIIINQFTHLGCDGENFAKLDAWNNTPQRAEVNSYFNYALTQALKRGVMIYIVASQGSEKGTLPDGTAVSRKKDTLSPSLKKIAPAQVVTIDLDQLNFIYRDASGGLLTAKNGEPFVHDKLYVTDMHAYVGGQNWYCPLEIDAGFLFEYGPVYFDLRSRAQSLAGFGYQPMMYSKENPYKGAIYDLITKTKTYGSVYPCISPDANGGDKSAFSTLSHNSNIAMTGTLNAYLRQLETARGDVDVFCWTMSPIEHFVPDRNKTPYFIHPEFIQAVIKAANKPEVNKITLVLCIHSFKYELAEYDLDSNLFCNKDGKLNAKVSQALKDAYGDLYALLNHSKVTLYLEGMLQDRVPSSVSSCNLFHAKVIANDNSISASSANFTPGYFFSATNCGVVFEIPQANQIAGYQDFKNHIFALQNVMCIENCGTETGAPCLRKFETVADLAKFCP